MTASLFVNRWQLLLRVGLPVQLLRRNLSTPEVIVVIRGLQILLRFLFDWFQLWRFLHPGGNGVL